ncbi:hypothetical protein [Parapedomonas caeni]
MTTIRALHRLVTTGQVDNAEATHPDAQPVLGEEQAAIIRPTVKDRVALIGNGGAQPLATPPWIPARNATHPLCPDYFPSPAPR